jgi:hypothetical protein
LRNRIVQKDEARGGFLSLEVEQERGRFSFPALALMASSPGTIPERKPICEVSVRRSNDFAGKRLSSAAKPEVGMRIDQIFHPTGSPRGGFASSRNPFLTTNGVAAALKIAFTTAQRAIERLERANIVRQTSDAKRNKIHCAQSLLDILEDPAQLTPIAG